MASTATPTQQAPQETTEWTPLPQPRVVRAKCRYRTDTPQHVLLNYNDVLVVEAESAQFVAAHHLLSRCHLSHNHTYTTR